jgi:hypothetical protein
MRWFWISRGTWYNTWSVSLTLVPLYHFTIWHNFISVINATFNCNVLPCGTNVCMYSGGPGWDNDYTEKYCAHMSTNVMAWRLNHNTIFSFLIIRHRTIHRYYFQWCNRFSWPGNPHYWGFTITLEHTTLEKTCLTICLFIAWRIDGVAKKKMKKEGNISEMSKC